MTTPPTPTEEEMEAVKVEAAIARMTQLLADLAVCGELAKIPGIKAASEADAEAVRTILSSHTAQASVIASMAEEIERLRATLDGFSWAAGVYAGEELTRDKIGDELHDYRMVLENVPEVYCHISGGKASKPNYTSQQMIALADDWVSDCVNEECDERLTMTFNDLIRTLELDGQHIAAAVVAEARDAALTPNQGDDHDPA